MQDCRRGMRWRRDKVCEVSKTLVALSCLKSFEEAPVANDKDKDKCARIAHEKANPSKDGRCRKAMMPRTLPARIRLSGSAE
jgi:hypothetical protein